MKNSSRLANALHQILEMEIHHIEMRYGERRSPVMNACAALTATAVTLKLIDRHVQVDNGETLKTIIDNFRP